MAKTHAYLALMAGIYYRILYFLWTVGIQKW